MQAALDHARAALGLDRRLRAYGPFLLILKIFVVLVLFGVLPRLGAGGHVLALLGFALLLLLTFRHGRAQSRPLTEAELRRQVEKASALPHRPLEALADQPATQPLLWEAHRARMARLVETSKLVWPKLDWRHLDHFGLRLASLLLVLVAFGVAQDQALPRLRQAVRPDITQILPAPVLDAWVTPPAYTGESPIALRPGLSEVLVPEGASLSVRVSGGWFAPVVSAGGTAYRAQQEEAGSYTLTVPVAQSGTIIVRQDGVILGRWLVRLLVDAPPQIAFSEPPSASAQGVLRLDYQASDDLGLQAIAAEIIPAARTEALTQAPIILPLPLISPPPKQAHAFRFFDLTAHPYAGRSVLMTLTATDSKGQTSRSAPVAFRLPERAFTNPIAKAIILLRRQLVSDGITARVAVMGSLIDLAVEVQHERRGDLAGYLALNAIAGRLLYNQTETVIADVLPLMWETALHFEDGAAGSALEELRRAQQALEDGLNRGADGAELQELMNRLESALQNYLQELAQQAQNAPERGEQPSQMISPQDVQSYLDQMRSLAESGARDQARQMLQNLSQLMENMRAGGQGMTGDPATDQALRQLGEIARDQQQLMERTFRTTPDGQASPSSPNQLPHSEPLPSPQAQQGLQQRLDQSREALGERGQSGVGQMLEQGSQAMQGAQQGLEQGDAGAALRQQGEALNQIQGAMQRLRDQAEAGQMQGSDPFGHREGNAGEADMRSLKIPDAAEADRVKALLDELRSRAGDMNRPQSERDYIERLLKWF